MRGKSAPGRFALSDSRRRLRRNASASDEPFEMSRLLCVRGAVRKSWMILPVETISGQECVSISCGSVWLMHVLCGKRRGNDYVAAVVNFVHECADIFASTRVSRLPAGMDQGSGCPAGLEPLTDAASSQAPAAKRGRDRILDSDDERDVAAGQVVPAPAAPRRRGKGNGQRRVKRGEFINITIRGFQLMFTVKVGPKIMVPVECPGLQLIVNDLRPRAHEQRLRATASEDPIKKQMTELDRGRLIWRRPTASSPGCWSVRYHNMLGQLRTFSKNLQVPRVSLDGERLSPEEELRAALQVMKKARREWNRLDLSTEDRFVV